MDRFAKITTDQIRNSAEDRPRERIYLANAESRVEHINAQRRLIKQSLVFRRNLLLLPFRFLARMVKLYLGLDASRQFARAERLHEVIIRTGMDAFEFVVLACARRKENKWSLLKRRIGAQFAQQAETIQPGHHHVAKDKIRLTFASGGKGRLAVGDCRHVEALAK